MFAFSISFNVATVLSTLYIDFHVCCYSGNELRNCHVLAVPIYDRHAGENMFNIVTKLLSSLCGEAWKDKLIGVATDGAANMVGRISGAVTRNASDFRGNVYRI